MLSVSQRRSLLGEVLRDVSRSFYLTLRVLPRPVRSQVGTAYLLARAADTIADTEAIAWERRLGHLLTLQQQFQKHPVADEIAAIQHDVLAHGHRIAAAPLQLGSLPRPREAVAQPDDSLSSEHRLLGKLDECFALYQSFDPPDRRLIAEVVSTLTRGMENDLRRFHSQTSNPRSSGAATTFHSLQTDEELDEYTFLVAGCVGRFWTQICASHLPALRNWDVAAMSEKGIRFGKGLQLINILRDLACDLRNGRCYLPANRLREAGLQPHDLLRRESFHRLRPLLNEYLDRALAHLEVGWQYTMAIPRRLPRLRLACIWPIWIGLQTLARIRHHPQLLDADMTVKISREEIYRIMARSTALTWSDTALTRRYEKLRAEAK